ncbi:hypothetical protein [Streptomyces sp. NPDC088736]|uniref:hypothetical protein n=1 Tax=Streptomyces sp. NPDC088736 TaxID=3365881 RepID=UPI0037FB8EC3
MARTKTPPKADTAPPAPPPDQPQEQARSSPVLAWPAEWPVPELPGETEKRRRTRGLPMGPALAGAGNATTLTATAAYSVGGPVAAAATGVVVAVAATAAVARRRGAVRRSVAARSGRATNLGATRSGGGSGRSSGPVAGARRSGTGGSATRAGSGSRSGSGRSGGGATSSGLRSGRGGSTGSGRHGSGLLGKHRGRHDGPGRHERKLTPRQQKKAAEKAARKALKNAAKNLATKSATAGKGHSIKAAASRAARSAWKTAAPHTARAARAAGRHARRAGSALLDGARALGAAAWTWLRRRDTAAALDRLKQVWRRRRKRDTPDTPNAPAVADTVRRPTGTTPASTAGGTMSGGGHHFVAPAMELARAAAQYQPQGMLQVGKDFAGLEEALRLHAEAMKTTVENADASQPLHPNIVELMRQIHGLQLKAAELASELQPAFRQLHDVDIARLENPRKGIAGERMWDVSANL